MHVLRVQLNFVSSIAAAATAHLGATREDTNHVVIPFLDFPTTSEGRSLVGNQDFDLTDTTAYGIDWLNAAGGSAADAEAALVEALLQGHAYVKIETEFGKEIRGSLESSNCDLQRDTYWSTSYPYLSILMKDCYACWTSDGRDL